MVYLTWTSSQPEPRVPVSALSLKWVHANAWINTNICGRSHADLVAAEKLSVNSIFVNLAETRIILHFFRKLTFWLLLHNIYDFIQLPSDAYGERQSLEFCMIWEITD